MQNRTILVGIVGISGSGKSTIATSLVKKLKEDKQDVAYVKADHYYKDTSHLTAAEIKQYNFDVPDAIDMEGLYKDLQQLADGKAITRRTYSYALTPEDERTPQILPAKVVIVEGIFLLIDERIRNLFSFMFMVDTPLDLAITRRLTRDKEKIGSCDKALDDYEKQLRPAAFTNVLDLKKHVHYFLKNENKENQTRSVESAKEIIKNKLRKPSVLVKTTLRFSPLLFGLGIFACKMLSSTAEAQPSPALSNG